MGFRSQTALVCMVVLPWISSLGLGKTCDFSDCFNKKIWIVDDGYTGQINYTRQGNKTEPDSKRCIVSFETEVSNFSRHCNYTHSGLWLLKENDSYSINMTNRNSKRPQQLCLVRGKNCTDNACQFPQNQKHCQTVEGNCSIFCVDTQSSCRHAKYKECENRASPASESIIIINGSESDCFKCGTPYKSTETEINLPALSISTEAGDIDPAVASETMRSLSSVVTLMGNKSTATVTMGPVLGILVKPKKRTEYKKVNFAYSRESSLKIIDDEDVIPTYPTAVAISKEAFDKAYNSTTGTTYVGVFRFPNMSKDEKNSTVLNNEVFAIDMGSTISNLTDTINLIYNKIEKGRTNFSCHSWNGEGSRPNWTTEGCSTFVGNDSITCECEHLTFFAVLMTTPGINITAADMNSLTYITYIGCGLSVFFLGAGLFMHFLLRKAKASNTTQILINLFVALFLLNLAFLSNGWVANLNSPVGCKIMAGAMHYSMLSSFSWFAVEALHLCLQLSKHSTIGIRYYLLKVCIAGWVPSALIVTVIFSLGKYGEQTIYTDDGGKVSLCWILDSDIHYIVNIGYYALVFIFTLTTFIITVRWLVLVRRTKVGTVQQATGTKDIFSVMGLCCLLGITWSFAFFSQGDLRIPSYYIFTILNSFQGFLLFLYYYNTSKIIGEYQDSSSSGKSSSSSITTTTTTGNTKVENPYEKP